jgi:hypothetical protein
MVVLDINYKDVDLSIAPGKIVLAAPCTVSNQRELLHDLQQFRSDFRISMEGLQIQRGVPKLIAKPIAQLEGLELRETLEAWARDFGVDPRSEEYASFFPKTEAAWKSLTVEKKILGFAACAIRTRPVTFLFLGDIHLEKNEQTFFFNALKGLTDASGHQLILLWSYRCQIKGAVPLFYRAEKSDAA